VIDGNVAAFGGFNPQDYFPSLAKVDMLSRLLFSRMHQLRKRWDGLLDKIIDDHASKASLQQQHEDPDADFVDVLLSRQHEYSLTRQHIKAILIVSTVLTRNRLSRFFFLNKPQRLQPITHLIILLPISKSTDAFKSNPGRTCS
jgi:S-adenosylmethionine synthetase